MADKPASAFLALVVIFMMLAYLPEVVQRLYGF